MDHTKQNLEELSRRLSAIEAKMDPLSESYILAPFLPYIQGAAGLGILWKILIAIGGFAVIYIQLKSYLAGNPVMLK